jgi:hypothetical protein
VPPLSSDSEPTAAAWPGHDAGANNTVSGDAERRLERGRELEGYAFTFCKAAFVALVLRRYTLVGTSLAASVLYILAARDGVRDWRCFVKPPWVVVFFGIVAALEAARLKRET